MHFCFFFFIVVGWYVTLTLSLIDLEVSQQMGCSQADTAFGLVFFNRKLHTENCSFPPHRFVPQPTNSNWLLVQNFSTPLADAVPASRTYPLVLLGTRRQDAQQINFEDSNGISLLTIIIYFSLNYELRK